jgi:signal transduction histidine kinase
LKTDTGEVREWIGTTNDVENRHQAEALERANAVKDEFVGLVSHELKTPVTTIIGNAELLQRLYERLDAESRNRALEDIRGEADRLQQLIDNMLALARLERGAQIELEPLVLPRIVDSVVESLRARVPGRPVIVESRSDDAIVVGSIPFVEQVLNNLLSNAVKYSPAGEPIEVHVERRNGEVTVDVLDRGAGIAPEESEQIFEPFYRSPQTAGRAAGIGVGLTVCRRVVEAQHGRLWARPREGGGSDFGFALPAATEHDA